MYACMYCWYWLYGYMFMRLVSCRPWSHNFVLRSVWWWLTTPILTLASSCRYSREVEFLSQREREVRQTNDCFLPANFNKFAESKCYFLGNLVLVVLVVKLPLPTSAEVPGSTPGHG